MTKKNVFVYPGAAIDVSWDERLCIHVGECGYAAGELFVGGRNPWCQPDLVNAEDCKEVVRRCPSGALAYTPKDGSAEESAPSHNEIRVIYNGPLFLLGELEILGATDDMPGVRYRAALCRCGKSARKPFCDNSHMKAGFQDYGAVGETGEATESDGGTLSVCYKKGGPLMLGGNMCILSSSGRRAWSGSKAALCRCGHSQTKPFCDGSHKAAGFEQE